MKILAAASVVALVVCSTGCAPVLGAHVHRFQHAGVAYVKCTMVAEESNSHLAVESLEVCRSALSQASQPAARH